MKFKVGDKVKINTSGEVGIVVETNVGVSCREILVRIKGLKGHNGNHYCKGTYTSGDLWYFRKDKLTPVNETIVIYRKGDEVIALDKATGEKGVAKCNPKDEFDFRTGAKLAFERLTQPEPELLNMKFCVVKTHNLNLTVGKIYEVKNGYFTDNDGDVFPRTKKLYTEKDLADYMNMTTFVKVVE